MRTRAPLAALAAVASLSLAACGSADDASTEASADTVEMPADEALAPIKDTPVADPTATATDAPTPAATEGVVETGDAASTVAAEAAAASEGEETPAAPVRP